MAKARINNKIARLWNEVKCDRKGIDDTPFGQFHRELRDRKLFTIKILREVKYNK